MKYRAILALSLMLILARPVLADSYDFAGGSSGSSGVSQITAGTGISISPIGGTGNVTITNTGAGSGTVTNFTAGTLSPLFSTSVATATTTPALTFLLSNAAANSWFGNATGSAAAPAFNTTVIPNALINFAAPAAIGSTTPAAGSFTNLSSTGTATFATGAIALSALNQTSATTNQVIGWNGSAWVPQTVSGSGSPAGSSTQVQFNTSGSFNASPSFTYQNSGITLGTSGGGTQAAVSLYGSSSGSSTILAPASGANAVIILPNANGAAGQVLTSTGSYTTAWLAPAGGGLTNGGAQSTSFTAVANSFYQVTGTATCTLPTAVGVGAEQIGILVASGGTVTYNTTSGQVIVSASNHASGSIVDGNGGDMWWFISDGTNWDLQSMSVGI